MTRSSCAPWILAAFAAAASCTPGGERPLDLPAAVMRAPEHLRIQVTELGRAAVRRVRLEDYVHATVLSEFTPAAGDVAVVERMYEVQAVISRTYAISNAGRHASDGYDLCSTTHCQLYEPGRVTTSRWAAPALEAVRRTAAAVLWFDRGPATALFHADCGGRTSDAVRVWGGRAHPYLTGVDDEGAAGAAHAAWQYDLTGETLRKALNADPRTRAGARLDGIDVLARDDAGRIEQLRIRGASTRIVRGEDFRAVLARAFGARTIRSTRFDIGRAGASYKFAGRGFGHGVGLCQAGAFARLRAGEALAGILARYYPGTRLVRLRG